MRLPRDITGNDLAQALRSLGYQVTRQTGSHIRLSTNVNGEHRVTIPAHNPLKVGTLAAILADVASHHRLTREQLLDRLFS
ncbi:type II toxin-antitoxin system HicA family toxin [Geomonas sp. Red32]|uniref:type II toxin-antitoxin system HicA family toxin n=1 Tax=Geomonas sp. Red32 TaxID=2912856 RepID=UPI00202CCE63|nr:type II toxin-antitoxin system HicA family toxin [Geomonas sp. Red32]MCM0080969.1 type II toxin-antitoxin system HicA family toxin [Geomonas sp. Red32]